MKVRFFTMAVCLVALSLGLASAQTRESNTPVSHFSELNVSGDFIINIVSGSKTGVKIEADATISDLVKVSTRGDILTVSVDDKKLTGEFARLFKGRNANNPVLKATITAAPMSLKALNLSNRVVLESVAEDVFHNTNVLVSLTNSTEVRQASIDAARITLVMGKKSKGTFELSADASLSIEASGSSELTIDQDSDQTDIKLSSSADLLLKGRCQTFSISTKGRSKAVVNGSCEKASYTMEDASDVNAINLVAKSATIDMNDGCSLAEAATDAIEVSMTGGASLIFAGNPVFVVNNIKNSSVITYENSKK